jgi:muramidase (phage lysozyme)
VRVAAGTIVWRDPATGESYETPVTGGHAKLQWIGAQGRQHHRHDGVVALQHPQQRGVEAARAVALGPIDEVRVAAGTIVWRDPATGESYETPVTGGHAKHGSITAMTAS